MDIIENAINLIKNGDNSAFEVIINSFQKPLFRYCYHMLGNISDAEDTLQEIFIKVYNNLSSYKSSTNFSAWVYTISYNHCVNFLSRKKLFLFLPLPEGLNKGNSNIGDSLTDMEYGKELNSALKILASKDRTILILRCVEEKSYDEISDIVKLKQSAVRKRYERAKKKLKAILENTTINGDSDYIGKINTVGKQ
ncbi:MAG: RNA polymerase sigma factor [Bacillota bacterium]|nr:RNA polymerase sigma factor [Bacillota bacterium]